MREKSIVEQAIELRRKGSTYTEIAAIIPVSKATLSYWLRDIAVPPVYLKKLQALKKVAREKAWEARRTERITRTSAIMMQARTEVLMLTRDPLWLVGLTLYWAEGSKEKSWGRGTPITFTNMDIETIIIFRKWCMRFLKVAPMDFSYNLYIHDIRKAESTDFARWWATRLAVPESDIHLYYKRTRVTHVRRNDSDDYHGVFRLQVRRSVDLNRRISGWTLGMIDSLKSVDEETDPI
ncbi:MAG: hypothetical protein AAB582_02050 [Patescibacteria group bacterium]